MIPEKNLREKMTNLSKQIKITIDMNVVNKNDNSQTTSSSASNWTRIKKNAKYDNKTNDAVSSRR